MNEEGFMKKGLRWLAKTKAGRIAIIGAHAVSLPVLVLIAMALVAVEEVWPELKDIPEDYRKFYANGYD